MNPREQFGRPPTHPDVILIDPDLVSLNESLYREPNVARKAEIADSIAHRLIMDRHDLYGPIMVIADAFTSFENNPTESTLILDSIERYMAQFRTGIKTSLPATNIAGQPVTRRAQDSLKDNFKMAVSRIEQRRPVSIQPHAKPESKRLQMLLLHRAHARIAQQFPRDKVRPDKVLDWMRGYVAKNRDEIKDEGAGLLVSFAYPGVISLCIQGYEAIQHFDEADFIAQVVSYDHIANLMRDGLPKTESLDAIRAVSPAVMADTPQPITDSLTAISVIRDQFTEKKYVLPPWLEAISRGKDYDSLFQTDLDTAGEAFLGWLTTLPEGDILAQRWLTAMLTHPVTAADQEALTTLPENQKATIDRILALRAWLAEQLLAPIYGPDPSDPRRDRLMDAVFSRLPNKLMGRTSEGMAFAVADMATLAPQVADNASALPVVTMAVRSPFARADILHQLDPILGHWQNRLPQSSMFNMMLGLTLKTRLEQSIPTQERLSYHFEHLIDPRLREFLLNEQESLDEASDIWLADFQGNQDYIPFPGATYTIQTEAESAPGWFGVHAIDVIFDKEGKPEAEVTVSLGPTLFVDGVLSLETGEFSSSNYDASDPKMSHIQAWLRNVAVSSVHGLCIADRVESLTSSSNTFVKATDLEQKRVTQPRRTKATPLPRVRRQRSHKASSSSTEGGKSVTPQSTATDEEAVHSFREARYDYLRNGERFYWMLQAYEKYAMQSDATSQWRANLLRELIPEMYTQMYHLRPDRVAQLEETVPGIMSNLEPAYAPFSFEVTYRRHGKRVHAIIEEGQPIYTKNYVAPHFFPKLGQDAAKPDVLARTYSLGGRGAMAQLRQLYEYVLLRDIQTEEGENASLDESS